MRYGARFLLATALVLPFGIGIAEHTAGAAGGTNCAKSSGTATFNPPIPKSGAGTTVKPKVTLSGSKATGCVGGGVTSAKLKGSQKFHDPTSCDILLSGGGTGTHPPTGTITATWNTGTTSVIAVTLNPVSGQPTETHITGTVTSGLFVGKHLDQTITFSPKTGDCVTADLSQVTFKALTHLIIK